MTDHYRPQTALSMPVPSIPLSAIRQPAFLYDAGGRCAASNAPAEALAGRPLASSSPDDIIRLFGLRHPDGTLLASAELPASRALAGEEVVDVPLVVAAADGRTMDILATATPIRDGTVGALVLWQDVTERKRAEEALRESEADARSYMESSVDACAICEMVVNERGEPVDIRLVEVNPAFLNGVPLPAERVVGQTAFSILPAMDRAWFDRFLEVGRTGRAVRAEEPFPALGRWYHVAAFPVRGGRVAVVFHDITEQREAEEALLTHAEWLRERDLRLNLALDVAAVGTFDWNPVTDEEAWDDRTRVQWGLPPGTPVTHETWESAIHPDDRAAVAAANASALDPAGDGRYANEYRVIGHCDGVERWITARGQVFFEDGRPVRMIGTTIDLTERKQAELALASYAGDLRKSREQLADVIEATGAGFYQLSLHAGQGTISRRGAGILGFRTQEMPSLLEIMAEAQARMHPDDLEGVLNSFMAFVETETERTEVEFRVRSLDGGWRWVHAISTSAQRDEAGRVIMLAGFLFDIDERKKAEAALRRSNEELQRFAYVASHDLQEPLRSVVSFSQLLARRYKGRLDADADEFIDFIVEGGSRMQTLIHDLLQVSRVETTAKPLEPTDAAAIAADVVRAMETPLREAGATVEADDLPAVMADATQLEQVFTNLIGNAIKYRHPGRPPVIRLAAWRVGPMVRFSVQDNGIGIEAEYFDRIFEMFRRLHTHDEYEGTGIGLAVVRKIVERHGGKVWVESTPGEGSTFFFTLSAA